MTSLSPAERSRREIYQRFFGPLQEIVDDDATGLDFLVASPGVHGRDFTTLLSSGLSDKPMPVPDDFLEQGRRIELVLYLSGPPRATHVALLRWVAAALDEPGTWLGPGHSLPHGDPPSPLFPKSCLDTVLLCPPVLEPDLRLPQELSVEGEPVRLLWLLCLSPAEAELKLQKGLPELFALLDEHQLPIVLDEGRASLV
ncbi:MAG: suppressor of fused domain protein [Acidobacteriota bacterium]